MAIRKKSEAARRALGPTLTEKSLEADEAIDPVGGSGWTLPSKPPS
jgi:hypothetical protein